MFLDRKQLSNVFCNFDQIRCFSRLLLVNMFHFTCTFCSALLFYRICEIAVMCQHSECCTLWFRISCLLKCTSV